MSKNQNEKVLQRLRRGPITALDALRELGCLRLAGRCFDLRMMGHKIDSRLIKTESGKHVAEYKLARSNGR